MPEKISCVLLIAYMFISAAQDIRYRKISLKLSMFFAVCGVICCISEHREITELFKALLPGMGILALSLISGGCVGIGDAVFVMVCALYMDPGQVMLAVTAGWGVCAVAALVIIILRGTGFVCASHTGLPYTVFAAVPAAVMKLHMLIR